MKKIIRINFISAIALIMFLILAVGSGWESVPDLKASVRFTGTQFIITNNDTYDWKNCKVEVNGEYKIKNKSFSAGQSYTVGAMQFVDSDGKKFNPITHKAQDIFFWCDNEQGKRASYLGSW